MHPEHAHLNGFPEAATPPIVATPVLDFDELLRRCMDKRDFALKLLNKVKDKLPGQVEQLQQHCQAGCCEQAALLAHELKGGTSSVGAKRLAAALCKVESAARAEQGEQLPLLVAEVHRQWLELSQHLTEFAAG